MRAIVILLIIGVLAFAGNALIFQSKTQAAFKEATAMLPRDPEKAYKRIEPIFEYSNITTFGQAKRTQRRFFNVVREKMIAEIKGDNELRPEWVTLLPPTLRVLNEARAKTNLPLGDHQAAIVEAIRARDQELQKTIGLAGWDTLVRGLDDANKKGFISADKIPNFEPWLAELRRVDRKAIGIREANQIAAKYFDAAIEALGLSPAPADGPLVDRLPGPLTFDQLNEAEAAFNTAEDAFSRALRLMEVKDLPPEMKPLWARTLFNHASMRVAHLMDLEGKASREVSGYMAKLYVKPGTDTIPSDGEIYGSFINIVNDQLNRSTQFFDADAPTSKDPEAHALRALSYWTLSQFWQATGREPLARNTYATFEAAREQAVSSPRGAEALNKLMGKDYPCLLLR